MIVSTPYVECYVKKSFLSGKPIFRKDETIFGVIKAIRFIRNRAPLFIVYFPSIGALYDKVDQCSIFIREETPQQQITMNDVGWWDAVSDNWQMVQIEGLRNCTIFMKNRKGVPKKGNYLWTCDPLPERDVDYGLSQVWNEHKTKTFFFDEKTGVLCSGPNNKIKIIDSSLSPLEMHDTSWLRVYNDRDYPDRITMEDEGRFGDTEEWSY